MSAVEQIVLRGDGVELVVLPGIGARIHRLRVDGVDLLRTPADPASHRDDPFFWGAYVMAPWCNRAPAQAFDVAGRTVRLASNFPDGSAIHGLVHARAWETRADGSLRIAVAEGDGGWPWAFEVTARPAVDGRTVSLDYELTNRSGSPMPAGIGLHPWFVPPLAVGVPAQSVYPTNTASPRTPNPVAGTLDLREPANPPRGVDATWSDLATRTIDLAWPRLGLTAHLDVDAARVCVAIAAPADLGAVAVEPQTHAPDGLRRLAEGEPDAVMLLDPATPLRLGVRLAFGPSPG
jgi:aldose 1-epimerase